MGLCKAPRDLSLYSPNHSCTVGTQICSEIPATVAVGWDLGAGISAPSSVLSAKRPGGWDEVYSGPSSPTYTLPFCRCLVTLWHSFVPQSKQSPGEVASPNPIRKLVSCLSPPIKWQSAVQGPAVPLPSASEIPMALPPPNPRQSQHLHFSGKTAELCWNLSLLPR